MKKLAVFGNPVAHSLSPTIHQMFAQSCGENIQYEKIECAEGEFAQTLVAFFSDPEAIGCNVTVPFKQDAYAITQHNCNDYAKQAQAVNTIYKTDVLQGFNTDGLGLKSDLEALLGSLSGCSVLLIGAGGAARGVIEPLTDAGVDTLHISNRTFEKAQLLSDEMPLTNLLAIPTEELGAYSYDIIINCTSASLSHQLPAMGTLRFQNCRLAYDMVYGNKPTHFLQYAKEQGALRIADGLGMLVGQAAEAFYIWTGKRPATKAVLAALREN